MLNNLSYYIRQTFRSLMRNRLMGIASIATTAIALFVLGVFVVVMLNIQLSLQEVESNLEIVVWLETDTERSGADDLESYIDNISSVTSVDFVSKEEGMRELGSYFGSTDEELLDTIGGENPLPDYLVVSVANPELVEDVAMRINNLSSVEKVDYGQGYLEDVLQLLKWVRIVGVTIISLLLFAVIFLIANTTRLTIFARKKEIEIMKNVGATGWFIRWPFLLEGMTLGFLGSLIAAAILYAGYLLLIDNISLYITFLPLITDASELQIIALAGVLAGTALGGIASYISLGRYLRF